MSAAADTPEQTVYVDLRTMDCGFQSEVADGECPFTARYVMVNLQTGGTVGACGHHVPDLWLDDEFGGEVIDAATTFCGKWLQRTAPPSGVDGTSPLTLREECGYRARVLVIHPDGSSHAACGYHARQTWVWEATTDDDE